MGLIARELMPSHFPVGIIRETDAVREAREAVIGKARQRRLETARDAWKTSPSLKALEAYEQALDDIDALKMRSPERSNRFGLVIFGHIIPLTS